MDLAAGYGWATCNNGCSVDGSYDAFNSFVADAGSSSTLDGYGTYVICNKQADDAEILAACDQSSGSLNFNGNDVLALVKGTGSDYEILDSIGEAFSATAPDGDAWTVCGDATATMDHTLVREPCRTRGNFGNWSAKETTAGRCTWDLYGDGTMYEDFGTYGDGCSRTGYEAKDCRVSVAYTQITCTTNEGVGVNHSLTASVGEQSSDAYDAGIDYAQPVVYYYMTEWDAVEGQDGGVTPGGEYVVIVGNDFGNEDQDAIDMVTYGPTGVEYVATDGCTISLNHTQIMCYTVPGTGEGHVWTVTIATQVSTSPTTEYQIPRVTNFTGVSNTTDDIGAADMAGGQYVVLTGENFGAGNKTLESVTYGPGGTEYDAEGCRIVFGHTLILCALAPGIGPDNTWLVTVDGLTSEASGKRTSYAGPVVDVGLDGKVVGPTKGGKVITLNGTNFGTFVDATYVEILFDGEAIVVDGVADGGATKIYNGESTRSYYATDANGDTVEYIDFVLPELTTTDQFKEVTLRVTHEDYPSIQVEAATFRFEYGSPVIAELQNAVGVPQNGLSTADLVVRGTDFSAVGQVVVNITSTNSTGDRAIGVKTYTPNDPEVTSWGHEQITLTVVGTEGWVTVVVGTEVSNTVRFNQYNPILLTDHDQYKPEGTYRTSGLTEGGGTRNLTLAGYYFGSSEDNVEVFIGENECPLVAGSLGELTDGEVDALDLDGASAVTVSKVTCIVPAGTGVSNQVTLYRSGLSNFVNDENGDVHLYLTYKPPAIDVLSPPNVSTTGGNVTVTGDNFGTDLAMTSVSLGAVPLGIQAVGYGHEYMVVQVPEGEGLAKKLSVTVDGQTTTLDPKTGETETITYLPPVIDGLSVTTIPTTGGDVTVTGSNFGRAGSATAFFLNRDGSALVSPIDVVVEYGGDDDAGRRRLGAADTHSALNLAVGEGYGRVALHLNVSGQVSDVDFDFNPPVITSFGPVTGPTTGGTNLTLTGTDFGTGASGTFDLSVGGAVHVDGDSDSPIKVLTYNHTTVVFTSPEGVASLPMDVNFTVGGQAANVVSFAYDEPEL